MTVHASTESGVATIRIDRPDKKNALDGATYRGLADGFAAAAGDDAVRAIVLTGGPDVFTSGNDVGDFLRVAQQGGGLAAGDFLRALVETDKPIIAAVNGWAVGIGTTMLLHCDFVYASPGARFKTPFVELGLCPEAASTVLLPAAVGARMAARILLGGEAIDAGTAASCGLITEIVDDPLARAGEVAARLASLPPGAMKMTKQLMKRPSREAVHAALAAEKDAFMERLKSPETQQAMMAFLTRRR
jgi:enoyl-CoA hydratase/carnithine racemase